MTRKRVLLLIVAGFVLVLGAVGYFALSREKESSKTNDSTINSARSGVRGSVLLGPRCPGPQDSRNAACGDTPYQTRLVVTTGDQAQVVKEFSSDDQGKFTVDVEPGEYTIRSAAAADVKPYCSSGTITVTADKFADTTIYCETGLR